VSFNPCFSGLASATLSILTTYAVYL